MRFFSLFVGLLSLSSSMVSADYYTDFNPASATTKMDLVNQMLSSTAYPLDTTQTVYQGRPSLQWDLALGAAGFAEREQSIQHVNFIQADNKEKSVHKYGVAATVTYSYVSGTVPTNLFQSSSCTSDNTLACGMIRFSTGTPNSMLGVGIAVFGDGNNDNNGNTQTRVFATAPTGPKVFNVDVPQVIGGISVEDIEGRLIFRSAPSIYGIGIADNKNHDFRADFAALPANTIVGYISNSPDSNTPAFNVSVTITHPLVASQAADQNLHFRRPLNGINWLGSLLLNIIKNGGAALSFFGVGANVFDVNVDMAAQCPFAPSTTSPSMMNNATIAAIVVASVTTLMAIISTSMLIKQRQQKDKQITAIPL